MKRKSGEVNPAVIGGKARVRIVWVKRSYTSIPQDGGGTRQVLLVVH